MDGNQISFKNNTFINNSGFRGGVIYSLSPVAKSSVQFIDCIFNNNTAEEGKYIKNIVFYIIYGVIYVLYNYFK